jgi:Abnormal spindle-like microcephaly-assoc'd, ASPM-SPD-2-Hydin
VFAHPRSNDPHQTATMAECHRFTQIIVRGVTKVQFNLRRRAWLVALSTTPGFSSIIVGMERTNRSRLRLVNTLMALVCVLVLAGCAGVSAGSNTQPSPPATGVLAVSPSTLNFGNIAVGSTSSLTGTLSASTADVTVSSASWSGSGYSVSGVTFPMSVAAGQSAQYTVTFTPPAAGSSPGSISFVSNASDASLKQTFSGAGTQTTGTHSVSLTWNPSTSTVAGYNLYRGTQSGGPYSRMNSALLPGTSYDDSAVQSGGNYFYVSTAVDASNNESAFSNEATAAIP